MSKKDRRKHYKVQDFPPQIIEEVNKLLATPGVTYESIVGWLRDKGHEIGKSSLQRYGSDFLSRMERLKVVQDQARAIMAESNGQPVTEMAEAANQLAMQLVMEHLMEVDSLEGEKITEILKALARLEQSGVRREELKLRFTKGVDEATTKIKDALRKELEANPELLNQMLDLVERAKDQVVSQ